MHRKVLFFFCFLMDPILLLPKPKGSYGSLTKIFIFAIMAPRFVLRQKYETFLKKKYIRKKKKISHFWTKTSTLTFFEKSFSGQILNVYPRKRSLNISKVFKDLTFDDPEKEISKRKKIKKKKVFCK